MCTRWAQRPRGALLRLVRSGRAMGVCERFRSAAEQQSPVSAEAMDGSPGADHEAIRPDVRRSSIKEPIRLDHRRTPWIGDLNSALSTALAPVVGRLPESGCEPPVAARAEQERWRRAARAAPRGARDSLMSTWDNHSVSAVPGLVRLNAHASSVVPPLCQRRVGTGRRISSVWLGHVGLIEE